MPQLRMPWPVVSDAFLAALAVQVAIAIAGHFIGLLGRHVGAASVAASGFMGFIFGVWSNPTPVVVSGLGGLLVAGGSTLVGAAVIFFMGDARGGSLLWILLMAAAAGGIGGAIGSIVGRSVFGA